MINVYVNISTNASEIEKRNLYIPYEAIEEFTGRGFAENIYNGNVTFECMPRAVNPDLIQIVIEITQAIGSIEVLCKVLQYIFVFVKRCRGYKYNLEVRYKDEHNKVDVNIHTNEKDNADKLALEILDKLKQLK